MPEPTEAHLSAVISVIERRKPWDEHLKQQVIAQFKDYFTNHRAHFFFLMNAYDIHIEIFIRPLR